MMHSPLSYTMEDFLLVQVISGLMLMRKLTGLTRLIVIHGLPCGLRISLSNWATIV